jgi:type II secretory pathway component HofQ
VARSAPSSRKGSSAKSAFKPVNQRRRSTTVVARNEVAANPVTQAMAVTAEVTAGAIEATGKVAAAAANMVQGAAETLAAVATGAAPDQGAEDGEDGGGRGQAPS